LRLRHSSNLEERISLLLTITYVHASFAFSNIGLVDDISDPSASSSDGQAGSLPTETRASISTGTTSFISRASSWALEGLAFAGTEGGMFIEDVPRAITRP
jgi:hypothetical protein